MIQARRFELRDENGRTVAFLGTGDYGTASLVFTNGADKALATLGVDENGPRISLRERGGDERALLTLDPNGLGNLALMDKEGRLRTMIGFDHGGAPFIRMVEPDGTVRFSEPRAVTGGERARR